MSRPNPPSIVETTLDVIANKQAPAVLEVLSRTKGLDALVWYPISNDSVYGSEDNTEKYNQDPDWSGRAIFLNIFLERYESSGAQLDLYVGTSPFMFSKSEEEHPRASKVEVDFKIRTLTFEILSVVGIYGELQFLYRKYQLIPKEV